MLGCGDAGCKAVVACFSADARQSFLRTGIQRTKIRYTQRERLPTRVVSAREATSLQVCARCIAGGGPKLFGKTSLSTQALTHGGFHAHEPCHGSYDCACTPDVH